MNIVIIIAGAIAVLCIGISVGTKIGEADYEDLRNSAREMNDRWFERCTEINATWNKKCIELCEEKEKLQQELVSLKEKCGGGNGMQDS